MTTIYKRIMNEVEQPYLLNDEEIRKIFVDFYDEIDELVKNNLADIEKLKRYKEAYIIPMLTDQDTINAYKKQAYEEREQQFKELRAKE